MTLPFANRRQFLKSAAAATVVAGVALAPKIAHAADRPAKGQKRFAIVGLGSRSRMYQNAIEKEYAAHAVLVGICDLNPGRLSVSQARSQANGQATPPPSYLAADFDKMIADTKPDTVIVTTTDGTHHLYINRAMELGCDVITEKPMTIDAEKCQSIIDTQRATGRKCIVSFNYRYSPPRTQIKELLMSGAIGQILSVDFQWLLNTHHGADYFRRWHADKAISGGLLVHKSTHHFDLVNWWVGAIPETVQAIGKREFYTPAMAKRMGLKSHHERCRTCPEADACGFYHDLAANRDQKALYLDNEHHDGYLRDRCVFRPEINIEDTMNVQVQYDNKVTLSYSLNAFNAWEGYHIAFNGTEGRIEHSIREQIYVSGTDTVQGGIAEGGIATRIIPIRGPATDIEPWTGTGSHGGGDKAMLDELFLPDAPKDKYLRTATQTSGAYSILTGVAANRCLVTGQTTKVADLVRNPGYPEYPPMPASIRPVPMPARRRS